MVSYRYSYWDGTQNPFDLDEDDVLEALSEDIMNHGDVNRAMRNLMRQGMSGDQGQQITGIRELRERLSRLQQQQMERYNLESAMDDIAERLEDIVSTERSGIERRMDDARQQLESAGDDSDLNDVLGNAMDVLEQRAQQNTEKLDLLPESAAGQIRSLSDYDFMDPEAQGKFQELMEMLRQQMMQNFFQGMKDAIRNMSPEDMRGIQEMIQALNQMLRDRAMGDDPDFEGFMEQYGHYFDPDRPASLDELIEQLQQQMASMQSLMDSMSSQMRDELEDMLQSSMPSEMMQDMAELASTMYEMFPFDDMASEYPFMGDESVTLDQAMQLMDQLQDMDRLDDQLESVMRQGGVENIDPNKVEELMGEDARRELEQLQQLIQQLEEAGYLRRKGDRLELTARGMRKLAQSALREVFSEMKKERMGRHEVFTRGDGGEYTGETRQYQFGDPFDIDMHRTLFNSVLRNGPNVPLRLTPEDLEVHHTEHLTQTATVLLLDQSKSMGMFGYWGPAKKVAMALYWLIHSQFPRDYFYLVGFSDYAMEFKEEELPEITWNYWNSGTNMQHGLMLARKLLSRQKVANKHIIMVTDGEPTSHLENGHAYFSYPPSYQTIDETLKEVKRCTQDGITINTFMLEANYYLMDFIDQVTKVNKGRAFYTSPNQLGQYVMVDYMRARKKRLA
ncbi:MAG: VWA domain-containing protein [Dehalococcoidia bacterium]|nr:VWA domain-containing protein [Dehalococcoidia bacterium]